MLNLSDFEVLGCQSSLSSSKTSRVNWQFACLCPQLMLYVRLLESLAVQWPCMQSRDTTIKREGAKAMNFMGMRELLSLNRVCFLVCLFTWPSWSRLSKILAPLHSGLLGPTWIVGLKMRTMPDSHWHLVTYNNIILEFQSIQAKHGDCWAHT